MQKKSNKRKNQGCTFWATPALFYAEQKELASLKQLFVLDAPKSTSALRPKSEANSLYATSLRSLLLCHGLIGCSPPWRKLFTKVKRAFNGHEELFSPMWKDKDVYFMYTDLHYIQTGCWAHRNVWHNTIIIGETHISISTPCIQHEAKTSCQRLIPKQRSAFESSCRGPAFSGGAWRK